MAGIPCLIVVTSWEPYSAARTSGPPDRCEPASGGYGDWYVADRRGRPAAWLEIKLTAGDRERIEREVFDAAEGR